MIKDKVGQVDKGQVILGWWIMVRSLNFILEDFVGFYLNGMMRF